MSAPLVKRSDRLAVAVLRLRRELAEKDATIAQLREALERNARHSHYARHGEPFDDCTYRDCTEIRALLAPAPREGA